MKKEQGHWGVFDKCVKDIEPTIIRITDDEDAREVSLFCNHVSFNRPRFVMSCDVLMDDAPTGNSLLYKMPYNAITIYADSLYDIRKKPTPPIPFIAEAVEMANGVVFSWALKINGRWVYSKMGGRIEFKDGKCFIENYSDADTDQGREMAISTTNAVTRWILSLCLVLNSPGGGSVLVNAPLKLNDRRRKRGQTELDDYHVLTIGGHRLDGHGDNGKRGGTRSHRRRGHVRRLPTDRLVWVRDSIVHGSKPGFVHKDYEVVGDDHDED